MLQSGHGVRSLPCPTLGILREATAALGKGPSKGSAQETVQSQIELCGIFQNNNLLSWNVSTNKSKLFVDMCWISQVV